MLTAFNQEKVLEVLLRNCEILAFAALVSRCGLVTTAHSPPLTAHPSPGQMADRVAPFWPSQQSARGAGAAGALGLQNNSIFLIIQEIELVGFGL